MTREYHDFPDIGEAVALLVEVWFPAELGNQTGDPTKYRVGRDWPDDFTAGQYACRVRDIGGRDDRITDTALLDIDVLAPTFSEARRICQGIRSRLRAGRHVAPNGVVLDRGSTAMRPQEVPWDDERVARWYSSMQVSARR